jgi:hypothetical protein
MNKFSLILYNLSFFSPVSFFIEKLSQKFVTPIIDFKANYKNNNKRPFYIIISIDTEAGYVKDNGERLWQVNNPQLFEGYYFGIRNWIHLLQKYQIKANFMLSSQCFSSKGVEKKLINKQIGNIFQFKHELGYHLHPRSDFALENKTGKKFIYTSSKFYSEEEVGAMLSSVRKILKENLGEEKSKQVSSFRWGNYGLFEHAIKPLGENGFIVDSSACPDKIGHQQDDKIFSWKKIRKPYPFYFKNSKVLEFPITTFYLLKNTLIANPIYHKMLNVVFYKYWQLNNQIKKPFFFVIVSHSSEATYKNGDATKVISSMNSFINYVTKFNNVRFITYKEAYGIYNATK